MTTFLTAGIIRTALELGMIYSLVALSLFISFSILDICDLSTDGCYTFGLSLIHISMAAEGDWCFAASLCWMRSRQCAETEENAVWSQRSHLSLIHICSVPARRSRWRSGLPPPAHGSAPPRQ